MEARDYNNNVLFRIVGNRCYNTDGAFVYFKDGDYICNNEGHCVYVINGDRIYDTNGNWVLAIYYGDQQPNQHVTHQQTVVPSAKPQSDASNFSGVGLTIFGILLTIGGISGLVYANNAINRPFFRFTFGGCHDRWCTRCDDLTMIIIVSAITIILGVIIGVYGAFQMKNNKA